MKFRDWKKTDRKVGAAFHLTIAQRAKQPTTTTKTPSKREGNPSEDIRSLGEREPFQT
jgi:hypothetical protein